MTISPPSLHAKHHSSAGSVTVDFSVRSAIVIAVPSQESENMLECRIVTISVKSAIYLRVILKKRYIFDKKKTINYYMAEGKEN